MSFGGVMPSSSDWEHENAAGTCGVRCPVVAPFVNGKMRESLKIEEPMCGLQMNVADLFHLVQAKCSFKIRP